MSAADYEFQTVTAQNWYDLEQLFESRGGPESCWCMVWRASPEEAKHNKGSDRKMCFKKRVDQGIPVGILAYYTGEPVAWCSIAPKTTYRNLTGKAVTSGKNVWSLVCFFIKRAHRNKGLTHLLTKAAIAYAANNGAEAVEAYPVEADSPSYRFMGFISTFKELGFTETGRAVTRRHIMIHTLS